MSTYVDSEPRTESRNGGSAVPAYGPIDSLLGFAVFYVFVDRATPTVVSVVTDAAPGVSPSLVGLGLAAALWFVFVVTAIDQLRRQLAALGIGRREAVDSSGRSRGTLSVTHVLGYLAVLVVAGVVAAWTFEPAIETGISLIRIVAALDVQAFPLVEFLVMVVFFVSFSLATRALDRLVVGAIRAVLTD